MVYGVPSEYTVVAHFVAPESYDAVLTKLRIISGKDIPTLDPTREHSFIEVPHIKLGSLDILVEALDRNGESPVLKIWSNDYTRARQLLIASLYSPPKQIQ